MIHQWQLSCSVEIPSPAASSLQSSYITRLTTDLITHDIKHNQGNLVAWPEGLLE